MENALKVNVSVNLASKEKTVVKHFVLTIAQIGVSAWKTDAFALKILSTQIAV